LVFALLAIADRFRPSFVFFLSSFLAALANLAMILLAKDYWGIMITRFITGFFIAGIYPVGMKIAADWYEKGLGRALGWLVGALVLGTAFPHLLKGSSLHLSPANITWFTSVFALLGGVLILLFVKEGPHRKRGQEFHPKNILQVFRNRDFRAAAFGYFGHMWELYTFWAFVPVLLQLNLAYNHISFNISFWSFMIIGIGCLSCIAGGYISQKTGSAKVAFYALLGSGLCCALSFIFLHAAPLIFLVFLFIWGITVIADSPQFSTLVAQTAATEHKGTALTIVTSIGFAITIVSVQLMNYLFNRSGLSPAYIFIFLLPGPVAGLAFLFKYLKKN
ncbi:MAG TPA: MFS transporter, partial [Chitinophagaceae bacterium]|nr:MFS transporter [Chitinophagaceae bacterium]